MILYMYYPIREYNLLGFRISNRKHKKYDAILINRKTGNIKYVPFGNIHYEHYRDSTPLHYYQRLDHYDIKRKKSFISRHFGFLKKGYYSPAYFSIKYLWT
jgi:hypothetical protein